MAEFKVVSDFDLMGDQPEAVDTLAKGIHRVRQDVYYGKTD